VAFSATPIVEIEINTHHLKQRLRAVLFAEKIQPFVSKHWKNVGQVGVAALKKKFRSLENSKDRNGV
jgi:hypothetical protein